MIVGHRPQGTTDAGVLEEQRESSNQHGGNAGGSNLRVESYTANDLNQYTQRTVPGAFWETGSAHSNATVAVASHLDDMVTSQWQGFDRRWHGLDQSRRPVLQTAHQRATDQTADSRD